jgi:hypothetical protein
MNASLTFAGLSLLSLMAIARFAKSIADSRSRHAAPLSPATDGGAETFANKMVAKTNGQALSMLDCTTRLFCVIIEGKAGTDLASVKLSAEVWRREHPNGRESLLWREARVSGLHDHLALSGEFLPSGKRRAFPALIFGPFDVDYHELFRCFNSLGAVRKWRLRKLGAR